MTDTNWRTHRLELDDQTLREWDANVLDSGEDGIVLDRSAFYPGGGGQPPDHGVLLWGGVQTRIAGARKGDDLYLLPVEGDPVPPAGTAIRGAVADQRRTALMRTHSGLHVLCGVVFRDFGALVTGGNMEPFTARMDSTCRRSPAASVTRSSTPATLRSAPGAGSMSGCCPATRLLRSLTSSAPPPIWSRLMSRTCGSSTSSASISRRTGEPTSPRPARSAGLRSSRSRTRDAASAGCVSGSSSSGARVSGSGRLVAGWLPGDQRMRRHRETIAGQAGSSRNPAGMATTSAAAAQTRAVAGPGSLGDGRSSLETRAPTWPSAPR